MYRYGEEEIDAIARVIRSGRLFRYPGTQQGDAEAEAKLLEREWQAKMGVKHACFTTSGTAALMCGYAGLGLGPGDEVIVPGYTFMATAAAVVAVGAVPVIVDVDESLMIDPAAIEAAITPRTRAIVPVHMKGLVCDMDRILAVARRHAVPVVEDACQCIGGTYKGRRTGSMGDMGGYSFNYFKVIGCGEGGMFVSNTGDLYARGVIFHDGGAVFRLYAGELNMPVFCGLNLRGNEILAAMMRVQLARLDGITADAHRLRHIILQELDGCDELTLMPFNSGPEDGTGETIGFRFADESAADAFAAALAEQKIGAGRPINSGKHVYANWEPILERRGSYSAATNPFEHPLNAGVRPDYRPDALPRTLELLRTTVLTGVNPDWTEADARRVAAGIRNAALRLAAPAGAR
ncbi:MAG: aminotransferase class V-fold PLP-dependent enzyme [Kiritimatiellae bacterium]|nr:aminotransferase class V-fold PLP-dependent enzyme [Kiritimatiellia bacterium]